MVKIFIGNLPDEVEKDEIEALFTQHGTVTECAKFKNYAFVHMDYRKSATKAIRSLHLSKLHGRPINVEPSRRKNQGPVKLHVEKGDEDALRTLFEEYGTVTECAVVKNVTFVHMSNSDEAKDAIQGLDNSDYQGRHLHVQISKRRPRREEEDLRGQPEPPHYRGLNYPPRSSLSPDARGAIPPYACGGLRCVHLRLTGRHYCLRSLHTLKKNTLLCLRFRPLA
uniref:RNA binding motif protein 4.3 n=1 Tax=Salmo trutta TaxID=8032 RepID=A0A673VVT3_SALTR